MKIRKFNETAQKTDWSKDKVLNFLIERDDMYIKEQYLHRRMEEFLIYNKELLPTNLKAIIEIYGKDFGSENLFDVYKIQNTGIKGKIEVKLRWDDGDESDEVFLTTDQINELVDYMNDMDIYKNINKYNL